VKSELKTLSESIQYLIAISDMLESVRRKYNSNEMYNGQQSLSTAIEQFKEVKVKLTHMQKQLDTNRDDEKEGN